jgi:hypothetical protein
MIRFVTFCGGLVALTVAMQTQSHGASIDHPTMHGASVDWCSTWATNCGAGGANLYCKKIGFSHATHWVTYKPGKTWVIGSDQYCKGDSCMGFSQVTCVAKGTGKQGSGFIGGGISIGPQGGPSGGSSGSNSFDSPVINGAVVDWCSTWATNCGAGGANLYCQMMGYSGAVNWTTNKPGKTWVVGSNQYCNGGFCVGFSHVTCSN